MHHLTQRTAGHVGWLDRGVVAPGYLADLNLIDMDALDAHPPTLVYDLPAGGRRLMQTADGLPGHDQAGRGDVRGRRAHRAPSRAASCSGAGE